MPLMSAYPYRITVARTHIHTHSLPEADGVLTIWYHRQGCTQ